MQKASSKNYKSAFMVITLLFFMWGFITCMNDILIPFLKKVFELSRAGSMLVQLTFFTSYFVGSIIYFIISARSGDPITRIGYKNGIILGLSISAFGCLLFYPAAQVKMYGLFLTALFILGLGFTLIQIAANPYVAILGKPENASSRLNLSQGFNSFGTTIAPIIGGYFVFHYFARWGNPLYNKLGEIITTDTGLPMSVAGVQIPYLIFSGVFILLAFIIKIANLPKFISGEHIEKGAGALKYRHLILGMIAIFMYVGGEVSIGSLLINYIHEMTGLPEMEAKTYLAFYWGGLMIGRFMGAISLNETENSLKKIFAMLFVAVASFFLIYFVVYIESGGFEFSKISPFLIFVVANFILFQIGKSVPSRTLWIFSIAIIVLLVFTIVTNGMLAVWSVIGIGLFNSIMWSNIFTLAISNLGRHTSQGSSLLVMMILGGALIPFIQGLIADSLNGYHYSFFVPVICYIYIAYYG
ncbi:MAG: sugar MFS transporter, partial [Bacteroidales bacterium]|nr:sugar MFS transporter [Bacteroidales bacterium]